MNTLIEAARALMDAACDKNLAADIENAATMIVDCVASKDAPLRRGRIITTGMGKAGHVARKLAGTLASIGFPAHYIHPGEAAHGDLGSLADSDLLFALSNSGKTVEVLQMVQQARALHPDIEIVAISTNAHGMDNCDAYVRVPKNKESDPDNLVPTTSMIVMQSVCDAISIHAKVTAGLGKDDFAARHHGGYLGEAAREPERKPFYLCDVCITTGLCASSRVCNDDPLPGVES